MPGGSQSPPGRLAIIAGGGRLPHDVAQAARQSGDDPFILLLKNEHDQDWQGFEHVVLSIGDVKGLARLVREYKIDRVVLSGAVRRRPEFGDIRLTLSTFLNLPSILRKLASGGDDTVLRMAIALIEGAGCKVIGAHEIAPLLLAETGPLGTVSPDAADRADIAAAMQAADVLGQMDIGQGAVAIGGRVVALEGAEGTDSMLQRVAALRIEGRVSARRKGVLVKLCKPKQDMRADLPTIGLSTIENAKAAGLAGVAIEAGRALVLERDALVKAADEAGLFVVGVDRDLPGGLS